MKPRLKRMSSGQSMRTSPWIPFGTIRRCASTTSAPATSIFFGSQPRSAQVPPNGFVDDSDGPVGFAHAHCSDHGGRAGADDDEIEIHDVPPPRSNEAGDATGSGTVEMRDRCLDQMHDFHATDPGSASLRFEKILLL